MFTIAYPLFERGRILKKELLFALRDYSFGLAKLHFSDYTSGIIAGCGMSVSGEKLSISPGILKFNRFVYVITEPKEVYYEPTEQTIAMKIRFSTTSAVTVDYVDYSGKLVLDSNTELGTNELEVCRFKLKRGSRLRCDYTGFEDIETEFDTVNLAHATWAGIGEPGISLPVLRMFAKEALECRLDQPWDIMFSSQCMYAETVHRRVIGAYLMSHDMNYTGKETNIEIYSMLAEILNILKGNAIKPRSPGRGRHVIEVD